MQYWTSLIYTDSKQYSENLQVTVISEGCKEKQKIVLKAEKGAQLIFSANSGQICSIRELTFSLMNHKKVLMSASFVSIWTGQTLHQEQIVTNNHK